MVSAGELVAFYNHYVSALWRGEESGREFENWLQSYWCEGPVEEPVTPPTALTPWGGIRWYETPQGLVGIPAKANGRYQLPADAVLPVFGTTPLSVMAEPGETASVMS